MYTQKYTLACFISPIETGITFPMTRWPLHVTLADVFSLPEGALKARKALKNCCNITKPVEVFVGTKTELGSHEVVLIEKTTPLLQLHNDLIALLCELKAEFTAPEYIGEGFLPHCSIQGSLELQESARVMIDSIALVDMFVDRNWKQRRVMEIFRLQG